MPVNYGLFNLTNSTLVPKRRVFPAEAYIQSANERQNWYNQSYISDLQTGEAADNMPWLPKDEPLARELRSEYQGRIAGRSAEGNLEDHVYDTIRDAQEFRNKSSAFAATYAQRQQAESELRKNAKDLQWTEADIKKHMMASDAAYQGVQKDPETGTYRGSFRTMSAVARPDIQKLTEDIVKGAVPKHSRIEGFASDGSLVYYTVSNERKILDAPTIKGIIQAGLAGSPAARNWMDYQAQVNTLADPWTEDRLSPQGRKLVEEKMKAGMTLPQIQYEMNRNQTLAEMTGIANQYGVLKFGQNDHLQGIGSVMSLKSLLPDEENYGAPIRGAGPDQNMTGIDKDLSVSDNSAKLGKQAADLEGKLKDLKSSPNYDRNVEINLQNQLDAVNRTKNRMDNVRENMVTERMDRALSTNEGMLSSINSAIKSLPAAELNGPQGRELRAMQIRLFDKNYKPTDTEKDLIRNMVHGKIATDVGKELQNTKPEAVSTATYQFNPDSKSMKAAADQFKTEIEAKPSAFTYRDMANNPVDPPEKEEKLEGISHMMYAADGNRYVVGTWVTKKKGGAEERTQRMVPMNNGVNNIGKIADLKLQRLMQYTPANSPLRADVEATRALINGTSNVPYAQTLMPQESTPAVDPVTGSRLEGIKIQRYKRSDGETSFRLLNESGRPIKVGGTTKNPVITTDGTYPDFETKNAEDLNNMVQYIQRLNNATKRS